MKSNNSVVNRALKSPGRALKSKMRRLKREELLYLCRRLAEFTDVCNRNDITLTVKETMSYIEDTIYCILHDRQCRHCPEANGKIEVADDWSLAALWGSILSRRAVAADALQSKVVGAAERRFKKHWNSGWGR